jgi:hypothetical protein
MDEVDDADLVVERVAALDLGKAGLEACVRVPHPQRPGRRMQERSTSQSFRYAPSVQGYRLAWLGVPACHDRRHERATRTSWGPHPYAMPGDLHVHGRHKPHALAAKPWRPGSSYRYRSSGPTITNALRNTGASGIKRWRPAGSPRPQTTANAAKLSPQHGGI